MEEEHATSHVEARSHAQPARGAGCQKDPESQIVCVFTIALILSGIGSVSAVLAWRGFHKTIVLVVNRDGFYLGESHTLGRFLLPWSEIEAIYLANKHLASLFCLSIRLRDLPHFRARLNPLQRLSVRKKPSRTGAPITIQQLVLDMPFEELLSQITERFADELNHYEIRLSRET